jgi:MFS family permease
MSTALAIPQPIRRQAIETDIPVRLDRLPWSRFHWLLVSALGVTWVLDGLEGTIIGAITPVLEHESTLGLHPAQMGFAASLYIVGLITGALLFGYLTDRLGRKKLFTVTLSIYLAGAILTACAWNFWSFLLFRLLTGLAIGGEYSAINSAIDELIPARIRGRVNLAINSTFWLGAILGAGTTLLLLNSVPETLGWRVAFGVGGLVGGAMILARQYVPESPRWLLTHGRRDEAEKIMESIEAHVTDPSSLPPVTQRITLYPGARIHFGTIARTLFVRYRTRAILGFVLIGSQALFYNGLSFTFPLVLAHEFAVPDTRTGAYVLCMALANLLGPMVLGHFFDTVGRRVMITTTYALAGVVIAFTEVLFLRGHLATPPDLGFFGSLRYGLVVLFTHGQLTADTQTLLWAVAFFFASAAASAGYLTVSEIFPVEMRGLAIALFFALGTAVAAASPTIFGYLVQTGQAWPLFLGYLTSALIMVGAAAVAWWLGVDTERKALEAVATPLTAEHPEALAGPLNTACLSGTRPTPCYRQLGNTLLPWQPEVRFCERDAALPAPAGVHCLVGGPDQFRLLALVAPQGFLLDAADAADVQVQFRPKAKRLLVGQDLEEVEAPRGLFQVGLPDERAGDVVIRMGVKRPVRDDHVRPKPSQPGGNHPQGRLVGLQFLVSAVEEVRPGAKDPASSGCLAPSDGCFRLAANTAIVPKGGRVGNDNLMTCPGQHRDQAATAGFRIVGMCTENDHAKPLGRFADTGRLPSAYEKEAKNGEEGEVHGSDPRQGHRTSHDGLMPSWPVRLREAKHRMRHVRLLQRLHLRGRQLQGQGRHSIFEMMRLRRPHDRSRHRRLPQQPGQRHLGPRHPARSRHLAHPVHDSAVSVLRLSVERLAVHVGLRALRAERFLPRSGQPAARQRTPGNHADPLGPAQGQHLAFLLAVKEVVVVLHRHEARPAVMVGQVQRLAELPGGHGRCAEVTGLARLDDVVQGFECLLNRRVVVPAVNLVEIDIVRSEPAQARVDLGQDRLARKTPGVHVLA